MVIDVAAAMLAVGAVTCAAAALVRGSHCAARLALAAALAAAAGAELLDGADEPLAIAACALAATGAARMVLDQHPDARGYRGSTPRWAPRRRPQPR